MKKGFFITLEGPEGSGKSSVASMLYKHYTDLGLDVVLTKEPGGVDIAEQIREVVLKKENTAMDATTELLLYVAARRQHLVEKVIPALNDGKIVICDRFIDSTVAYQGYGRGIDIDTINALNSIAADHKNYPVDLTLLLDISPSVGLSRIIENRRETNRLDEETLKFHQLVRQGYLEIAKNNKDRVVSVNAGYDLHTTFLLSKILVDRFLKEKGIRAVEVVPSSKRIIVLVGPSGSGKTTLIDSLGRQGYPELVSHTTREKRASDVEGKNYFFVDKEEFKKQEFVEVVEYAGHLYGLSRDEIEQKLNRHSACVIAAAIDGAVAIKEKYPKETKLIFLDVNPEICIQRMKDRGDPQESIEDRIKVLNERKEFDNWKYCDAILSGAKQTSEQILSLLDLEADNKKILVFVGPSGSGKTALVRGLNKDGIPAIVTHTTRKMRANEFNGIDYYFVSEEEFMDIEKIEYALYAGSYYGISKQEISNKLKSHPCVAVVTSIEGAYEIRKHFPKIAQLIYISVNRDLAIDRMKTRGDSQEIIKQRLEHREKTKEFENWKYCDFVLNNNDSIEKTLINLKLLISEMMTKNTIISADAQTLVNHEKDPRYVVRTGF